ncbi:MAG: DUF5063 domain-containing protein [Muribaculaceae bacterium]
MTDKEQLSPNSLAFIALANEYCSAIENVLNYEKLDFMAQMIKLLPRIYISATDIKITDSSEEYYIEPYLEEEYYDNMRNNIAALLGEDDVYLETFQDDMKYSDTPISANISEDLADLYQEFYNFVASVRDVSNEAIKSILITCKEDFANFWGQQLCNVLRALHSAYYIQ